MYVVAPQNMKKNIFYHKRPSQAIQLRFRTKFNQSAP